MTAPAASLLAVALLLPLAAQDRVILAIGAHAGDMEVTAGAVLAKASRAGAKVVLLHLTLGEKGHLTKPAAEYGEQKKAEALAAAQALGASVEFGPYPDGSLRAGPETEAYVASVIRQVKPTHVITHSARSIHPDHEAAHAIVRNVASLANTVRGVGFAENWEDREGFQPYLYMDVTADMEAWRKATQCYQFLRGGISPFPYLQYYEGLTLVRGAEARRKHAIAFDIEAIGKKRVLDALP